MNFLINRAEVTVVSGICRTTTFALTKADQLRVLSKYAQKSWFCLMQVLERAAILHGLPPPDAAFVQLHINALVKARLERESQS
jgi:hypothetical protein